MPLGVNLNFNHDARSNVIAPRRLCVVRLYVAKETRVDIGNLCAGSRIGNPFLLVRIVVWFIYFQRCVGEVDRIFLENDIVRDDFRREGSGWRRHLPLSGRLDLLYFDLISDLSSKHGFIDGIVRSRPPSNQRDEDKQRERNTRQRAGGVIIEKKTESCLEHGARECSDRSTAGARVNVFTSGPAYLFPQLHRQSG